MNRGAQMLWGLKRALIVKLTLPQEGCLLFLVVENVNQVQFSVFAGCFSNICCGPVAGTLKTLPNSQET